MIARFRTLAAAGAAAVVLLAGACRQQRPAGPATGAATPRAAVEALLLALNAEDLQAISSLWGTTSGPSRGLFEQEELEKRSIAMVGCFKHDRARIVSEGPGEGGGRRFLIDLSRGTGTRTTTFNTVQGPAARWYVNVLDIDAVRDFCRAG